MEEASAKFYGCVFAENAEEAVVVMDSAVCALRECTISGNLGPGADVSGKGRLVAEKCAITGNVGGLWLWDSSKAVVTQCSMEGGSSHVILADGDCLPCVTHCKVEGMIQATDEAWEGICMETNTVVAPTKPVELPPEEGPFQFEPVWYQRKQ